MENNGSAQQLTKKENKELRRQKKIETREAAIKTRRTKKIIRGIIWSTFSIVIVAGLVWLVVSQSKISEDDIISQSGFHWHPKLTIYIKGEKQELPADIGIGAVHQPIHTHSDDNKRGVIHLEFQGLTRKKDVTLGQFFKNWGKDIKSFGTNVRMIVNGNESTEYENYIMHHKDEIELWFN